MKFVRELRFALLLMIAPTLGTADACTAHDPTTTEPDSTIRAERVEAVQMMARWNAIALRTTASGPFSPPRETRTLAMVSAAMFDAVNAIEPTYAPFAARLAPRKDVSIRTAVATAAYQVLKQLYPGAVTALDADLASSLSSVRIGVAKDGGVALGEAAAAAVISSRAQDHAFDQTTYTPQTATGMWAPTPPAFAMALEAGWGRVKPFALDSGSQFRPPPPPTVGTALYTQDLQEIAAIGAVSSATRTPQQTETARFWVATASQLWNQVAQRFTVERGLAPAEAARAYLLLNVAGADAVIAAWEAKYVLQQWRPVSGIRYGAIGGALGSSVDTTWTPLLPTPPFPDYPAGHTAYAGAAEMVLTSLFGDRPGTIELTSQTAGGVTHRYQTFGEVADEVVNARVWGGVHWRTSSTVGRDMGRRVASLVLERVGRAR